MANEDVLHRYAAMLLSGGSSRTADAAMMEALAAEVRELRERKDGAYYERNQVVAALAKCFPSGIARTAIEGWSEDWHGCVYIDLPTGQVSWHFHDSHAHLFTGLPPYSGSWDGHDTPEKYRRLNAIDGDLRKDKARLDWLHSLFFTPEGVSDSGCVLIRGATRAMIDAAMDGEAQTHD